MRIHALTWRDLREFVVHMTIMAAACGILIVLLGLLSAGRNPTEAQSQLEITCLVGGLILCFLAVVLSRLTTLTRRLDAFEVAGPSIDAPPAPIEQDEGREVFD